MFNTLNITPIRYPAVFGECWCASAYIWWPKSAAEDRDIGQVVMDYRGVRL